MPKHLRLISHKLCPYVQRAVIVATEKGIDFERVDIDLANKPDWFLAISPTGKVPVLEVTEDGGAKHILFESAVIAEYLDEIGAAESFGERLLPTEPLARARERAWIEYGAQTLADIYRFYASADEIGFNAARRDIAKRLDQIEREVAGPWFAGESFGLVDAAFAPVFRYFDAFDRIAGERLIELPAKTKAWARALAQRPSVITAVPSDYERRLADFVIGKRSYLARLIGESTLQAA